MPASPAQVKSLNFFRSSGVRIGKANKAQGRAESDKAVQAMKTKGLTVHPVTPALEAQWRTAAETMYPYIQGKFVSAEIFAEVQKVLKEYRADQAASQP